LSDYYQIEAIPNEIIGTNYARSSKMRKLFVQGEIHFVCSFFGLSSNLRQLPDSQLSFPLQTLQEAAATVNRSF
jgi:hypothetical protein